MNMKPRPTRDRGKRRARGSLEARFFKVRVEPNSEEPFTSPHAPTSLSSRVLHVYLALLPFVLIFLSSYRCSLVPIRSINVSLNFPRPGVERSTFANTSLKKNEEILFRASIEKGNEIRGSRAS